MTYTYHTVTHPGTRAKNEDDYYPRNTTSNSDLFIVCDGLGGHGDGDLAAAFVANRLGKELRKINELDGDQAIEAFNRVDEQLFRYAVQVGNTKMGSTAAFIKLNGKKALLGWVGDSRIYQFRNGQLCFKSTDHTLVELMQQNGQLSEDESKDFPMKHIIWQAIGPHSRPLQPSIEISDVEPGDRFLLATDGLTNSCDENYLSELIMQDEEKVVQALHDRCQQVATDNFTFTVISANKAH
jgi:serine/threonine protein phosphatase PrpC